VRCGDPRVGYWVGGVIVWRVVVGSIRFGWWAAAGRAGGLLTTYLPGFLACLALPTETLLLVLGSIRALQSSLA
jgi:hypothetical protein